jgi:hypothetical protein
VEVISGPRRKTAAGYLRTMRCKSCRTERQQLLDSAGSVIRNGYKYRDGYLATEVETGTYSRDTFRLESVTRWLDKHPVDSDDSASGRADASVIKLPTRKVS